MKTTFAKTTVALLALMLFGLASMAQQAAAPAQELGDDGAAPATNSQPAAAAPAPATANSRVRIVRLSQVKGGVQLDPNTGNGFEAALPNLPVTEGAKLQTNSGLAEVEFEDNSTLRLTPDTVIEFSQLELRPTGAKVSVVNVLKGTVYASLASAKGNEFTLTFGGETLTLPPSSHIRLQVAPAQATLAVLEGNVQVEGPSGVSSAGKKKTLTFALESPSQPTLAKNVAENQYDAWDQDAVSYHQRFMNSSGYGSVPYSYGISDMNYYGGFVSPAGCGAMWRPYFVSAAWDPYANGVWAWYSGAGYSWVSPYPWGWMPFHYGSWDFCPGMGWGWRPGGSWMGLANAPIPVSPLRGPRPVVPVMPSRPPIDGRSTLIAVNQRPLAVSNQTSRDTFVFRNDSAGLGIPRGSFAELGSFSHGVEKHGSVSMPVYPASAGNGGATSSFRPGVAGRTSSSRVSNSSGSMESNRMGSASAGSGSVGPGAAHGNPGSGHK